METKHITPGDIERTSMSIIEEELKERGIVIPEVQKPVVKRVIHTSADFDYAENLAFTDCAIERGVEAMKEQVTIITDTNMAYAGISNPSLKKLGGQKICYMADEEIAAAAKARGVTRAAVSMEKGAKEYPEAVFAIGNAPTALIKLSELMEQGFRPSLIIGVPVGFVNVVESKEELFAVCKKYDVPAIVARGRKGGSNVAACICNALLYLATDSIDPANRGWH